MRSPLGELVSAVRGAVSRPRNAAPVPYVASADHRGYLGMAGGLGDQSASIYAPGDSPTLFAIIEELSTGVAAVDWHMHKTTRVRAGSGCDLCERSGVQVVDEHPALSVWNRPNDHFTQRLLIESYQQHVDLVGEGWWVVARLMGRPIELWPVRPDRMSPVRDPRKFIAGYMYRAPDGTMVPLKLDEVIYTRKPAPWDVYRGAGVVQTLISKIHGAAAAAEWNRQFFANSAIPGGIIEIPTHLDDVLWREFQQRWAETHRGVGNAHTVATLEHGAKWVDVKYTQKDMEFVELGRVTREELREAFAIHGHVLGLSESVNRANAEAADVSFGRRKLVPRLDRLKDTLNGPFLRLFGDQAKGFEFCYASPVPADRESDNAERNSKASAYKSLVEVGVEPEDAAMVCGLPPMRHTVVQEPVTAEAGDSDGFGS